MTCATLAATFAAAAPSQTPCWDFGSTPKPATLEASALPLGCGYAPSWPQWHLFTPAHRAPTPHVGFNPGQARMFPRILVTYRCTGLVFAPIAIDRVRTLGYVIDQPEYACTPGS